jgi:hypothetical protein
MAFRSQDIADIIADVATPYPKFSIFTEPQIAQQRLYPSCEVFNIQPESTSEQKDITEIENRFEIVIFDRYGSNRTQDTENLRTTEQNIIALIEGATLDADEAINVGKIVLEQRNFTRAQIRDNPNNINGIQSTLVISIVEIQATEAGVALGGQSTITIGTITDAQVYDKPLEREFDDVESIHDKTNVRTAVMPVGDNHVFFFTIGFTAARETELRNLLHNRAKLAATYKRNGVASVKNGWLVQVENGAPFESVETLDCMLELVQ